MLKGFNELVQIDVLPFCDKRKAKDDNGKPIEVPYLPWAKCKMLLHENGASEVYFVPLKNETGGYLFQSKEVHDKNGRTTGCYFVSVEIHIDDKTFRMDMPLMNGSLVVYDDTLNQLRISNAHARAFVKGVAIHTGLGLQLSLNDKDTDRADDDLYQHSIMAIKQRIEQLITLKLQNGADMSYILSGLGLNQKKFDQLMASFGNIQYLENTLKRL